jgi:outer membrane murein-binding lipoprotein Lpp
MAEFEDKILTDDAESSPDESITSESEGISPPTPSPEGRTRGILRNIIRWSVSLLIAFGLGALIVYFMVLLPTQRSLDQNTAELEQLTTQVDSLNNQLDELTKTNQELEDELSTAQLHIILLSTISDVRAANLAVSNDDYAGALLSLKEAAQSLVQLDDAIGEEQGEVITVLMDNLSEIEGILKTDPESAIMNLQRLTANLIKLDSTILK